MIQLLECRQVGIDHAWLMPKIYGSYKWTQLSISRNKSFQRVHQKGICALDHENSSSRYLLSGGASGTIAIHDTLYPVGVSNYTCPIVTSITGSSTPSAHTHSISALQWYPHDTGIFTSSSTDKTLRIWDTNEMCVVEKFKFSGPVYSHTLPFSKKHSLIAVGCKDNNITLCDIQSGSDTHILRRHRQSVLCVKWSPSNEHLLASGSQDNQVFLWDIRKATGPLLSLDQHNGSGSSISASVLTAHNGHVCGMTFTSDGLFLVTTGTDQRMRLWDVFTGMNMLVNYGRVIHDFKHQTHQITLTPHTLTHTPQLLVPTRSDIGMYELLTGKLIRKMKGHYGKVTSCVANHSSIEMYTAATDTSVLLWTPLIEDGHLKDTNVSSQATIYRDTWSSDED